METMKRCRLLMLVLMCLSALPGGCGRQHLMRTPALFADSPVDPFAHWAASDSPSSIPVFVIGGRTVSGETDPARFYTNDRSTVVRLGLATVEIGRGMTWEALERESRAERRSTEPAIDLTGYEEFGVLWTSVPPPDAGFHRDWEPEDAPRGPADRLVAEVDRRLAAFDRKEIYIYVHGFNTDFAHNIGVAAEMWYYLGGYGVMMSFAWPSEHSIFGYEADKANADYSTRQFREFLVFLARHTSVERIHILAHSAGTPIVVEALEELRLIHYGLSREEVNRKLEIGRVILAAPDMDLLEFVNASLDGFDECAESVAIYASTKDKALRFSGGIFDATRLGASVHDLSDEERAALALPGISHAVDVTEAQRRYGGFLGHSYYHQDPWVSSDVALYLRFGLPPSERGLVWDSESGFWTFPDDYAERLARIAEKLAAEAR